MLSPMKVVGTAAQRWAHRCYLKTAAFEPRLGFLCMVDHRGVKRITQPMLGFKLFWSAIDHHRWYQDHAHDSQGTTGLP
jgi:hypothetical protein